MLLYFKEEDGSLIIREEIEKNNFYHFKLPSHAGTVTCCDCFESVSPEIWESLRKKMEPSILEENPQDFEIYNNALSAKEEFEQFMAEQDWLMEKSVHWMSYKGERKSESEDE